MQVENKATITLDMVDVKEAIEDFLIKNGYCNIEFPVPILETVGGGTYDNTPSSKELRGFRIKAQKRD